MNDKPIAVFDSGVGGLTVLKELERLLPNEDFIYLGDTARTPYGTRSVERIQAFAVENIIFLMHYMPKMIVVACNTVSSTSLDFLQNIFAVPIIGVIKPGAIAACHTSSNRKIGVTGTQATIKSGSYKREIEQIDNTAEVFSAACPLFVPLAEEGFLSNPITDLTVEYYLHPLKNKGIDTLLLGCTHYPLLIESISRFMGDSIKVIDSAYQTARDVEKYITSNNYSNSQNKGTTRFFVTDSPEKFKNTGQQFLYRNIENVVLKPV